MAKKLEQFSGELNLEKIAEGMNLAKKNALRLYEDAQLLFDAGRFASAISLAILSIEESGKVNILRRMCTQTTPEETKALWKEYRSHTKKNMMWAIIDFVKRDQPLKLLDFAPLFNQDAEHPYLLDQMKQLAFYSDCLGKGKWSDPVDVVERDFAQLIVISAKVNCTHRRVTTRELELWRRHCGKGCIDMQQGLLDWHTAMHAEGLEDGDPDHMRKFVNEGVAIESMKDHAHDRGLDR
jgi:AbiV family abortive infection protein